MVYMPYLGTLKAGDISFSGDGLSEKGRLTMEQPEIYRPEAYARLVHSIQPVYGQTRA